MVRNTSSIPHVYRIAAAIILLGIGFYEGLILSHNYGLIHLVTPSNEDSSSQQKMELLGLSTSDILASRQEELRRMCHKFENISKTEFTTKSFITGKKIPYLYCNVPKVGSSTFKRLLYSLENNISNLYKYPATNIHILMKRRDVKNNQSIIRPTRLNKM
ncbi:unnamed protein product, partial [Owenia fusiformis]